MSFLSSVIAKKTLPKPKKKTKKSTLNLKDSSEARAWALKNINDLDGDEDEDGDWVLSDQIEDRISDYCYKYREVMAKSTVTIYRAVCLKKMGDLNLKVLGPWWSFEEEGTGCYGTGTNDKKITVELQAEVSPKNIDWETGFTSFLWYGEDQWEAAVEPGAAITLTHIDGKKLDKPVKAKA